MNIPRLTNHIAYRFLNDETLLWEIIELIHPNVYKLDRTKDVPEELVATYALLNHNNNKNYYITNSVTEKLELLKVSRDKEGRYDYTIFKHIKPQKCTFILPDNKLVRVVIGNGEKQQQMVFDYLRFDFHQGSKLTGEMNNCLFYVDRLTGEQCSHFQHSDVKEIEDRLYKLMCFVYLSDIEEIILKPGHRMGTRKSGKVFNELKHSLIVVTSKWNITSIRTEGFPVSGHFRLQPCGKGRNEVKVVLVDPYEKKGYVRKAKKQDHV